MSESELFVQQTVIWMAWTGYSLEAIAWLVFIATSVYCVDTGLRWFKDLRNSMAVYNLRKFFRDR